jgi:hypothetical protein
VTRPNRSAISLRQDHSCSFDHLVGTADQRKRDDEAERLGGLEVDDQFHLGGLLDRQIGGFFALENTAGICASLSICTQGAARVAHQTASCREGACLGDRGHPVAKRQRGEMFLMCNEENIARYYKPADPLLD